MEKQEILQLVKEYLPILLEESPELKDWVERLTAKRYADRQQTESRFDLLLEELRNDREEQARKWDEQNKKWDENQRHFDQVHEEIMTISKKIDRSVGALGARWGMQSEATYRQALAGILENSFDVKVQRYLGKDESGTVFGRPDQVELDILIFNGTLLIIEMKSSMSRGDVYIFERKARFYEQEHQRKANRLIIISPMVDPYAETIAQELGIEIYSDSLDVKPEAASSSL